MKLTTYVRSFLLRTTEGKGSEWLFGVAEAAQHLELITMGLQRVCCGLREELDVFGSGGGEVSED